MLPRVPVGGRLIAFQESGRAQQQRAVAYARDPRGAATDIGDAVEGPIVLQLLEQMNAIAGDEQDVRILPTACEILCRLYADTCIGLNDTLAATRSARRILEAS